MKRLQSAAMLLLVAIVSGLMSGCGGGPVMIKAEQDLMAGPDASLIVFLRPNPLFGQEFSVWDRERLIGLSDSGTSISYRAKAGEHMFLMKGENWEIVKGKVEAGKTYYIWIDPRVGIRGTRLNVAVLDPNDKRIDQWKQVCRPMELASPEKGAALEKKFSRHVAKAVSNVEAGKARFVSLNPGQGK